MQRQGPLYPNLYPGALHAHSHFSDGTGTTGEIAAAARRAGLRWLILTDHNTLQGRAEQGWYGNLLVIAECEITPPRNHFLAFDLPHVVDPNQSPQQMVDAIYAAGGWGMIAHPDERTDNKLKRPYNWSDWQVDGPSERAGRPVGIEAWNWMSDWAEQLRPSNKYLNYFFPRLGIRGPSPATLAWWDRLNAEGKRTFASGNLDSHAKHVRSLGRVWEVFPYEFLFRTVTNYLWSSEPLARDFKTARRQLLDALAAGQLWFANRQYGRADRCHFEATVGTTRVRIGQTMRTGGKSVTFNGDVKRPAVVRLIRNGRPIAQARRMLQFTTDRPGTYRFEARCWRQPWLFTNPIHVEA